MKTVKLICAFMLVAGMTFMSSCSSDDNGGGGGNAALGTIKAKVDGTNVTTMSMVTFATRVGSMLSLSGNTGGTSSKAFSLIITTLDGVGTYDIGGGSTGLGQANASYTEIMVDISNPAATETKVWQAPYTGSEKVGEINISEISDTNVKGTFFFTCKNSTDNSTKNVTEGSFNINF